MCNHYFKSQVVVMVVFNVQRQYKNHDKTVVVD
jgi:hypothetical protein